MTRRPVSIIVPDMTYPHRRLLLTAACSLGVLGLAAFARQEWKSGIDWKEPPKVEVPPMAGPAPVPSDAIILFDGSNLDAWESKRNDSGEPQWILNDDGSMSPRNGGIQTKQNFGDVQLHVEFATPAEVKGSGQGRGNSGVFLMDRYEVQILDSYENETYYDGQAASIYKQSPPFVNASRGPGEWQSYDIVFEAPRFDDQGNVDRPAYVTVFHNGVLVQNHLELQGGTFYNRPPSYEAHADKLPISLQDHGNPVRFRNIWVRELSLSDAERQN